MSFIAQSGLPVIFCGDVSHEAVDSEVVAGPDDAAQVAGVLHTAEQHPDRRTRAVRELGSWRLSHLQHDTHL